MIDPRQMVRGLQTQPGPATLKWFTRCSAGTAINRVYLPYGVSSTGVFQIKQAISGRLERVRL
jgi:hypothetical protein